jgi:hypothetical protein
MPLPALDRLVKSGGLKNEPAAASELELLIHSGKARLKDARNESLELESRFDLAYNAAHAVSLAALRFHGYRSENRYLVFQALVHTVGLTAEQWRVLDDAHRKRNAIEYRGVADVDEQLVAAVIRIAGEVCRRVLALIGVQGDMKGG